MKQLRPGLLLACAAALGSALCFYAWKGAAAPEALAPVDVARAAEPPARESSAPPAAAPAAPPRRTAPIDPAAAPRRAAVALDEGEVELARAGTEKAHYLRFLSAEEDDRGTLARLAPSLIAGGAPSCEKVALLRALYDMDPAAAGPAFVQAIGELSEASSPVGSSIPDFAVRFLTERARDPAVRVLLERVAFEEPQVGHGLRRRAAARLAEVATEDELLRMSAHLARETDALLLDGVAEALSRNPARLAAERVALGIGRKIDREAVRETDG